MVKCVYCGKNCSEHPLKAKAHTREFDVCDESCRGGMDDYLVKDKKFKIWMYLLVFIGGIGFLLSAVFFSGPKGMFGAYLGQIVAGIAFLVFPYPIMSFETFQSVSMKGVTRVSRIIGTAFILWGIILMISLF